MTKDDKFKIEDIVMKLARYQFNLTIANGNPHNYHDIEETWKEFKNEMSVFFSNWIA